MGRTFEEKIFLESYNRLRNGKDCFLALFERSDEIPSLAETMGKIPPQFRAIGLLSEHFTVLRRESKARYAFTSERNAQLRPDTLHDDIRYDNTAFGRGESTS